MFLSALIYDFSTKSNQAIDNVWSNAGHSNDSLIILIKEHLERINGNGLPKLNNQE